MKKGFLVSLVFLLFLTGCAATSPALKDIWLEQVSAESGESKMMMKLELEIESSEEMIDEEMQLLLDVLRSGIVMEQVWTKEREQYVKFSFADSSPIKQLEEWKSDREPYIEIIAKADGSIYGKTSSEDRFIQVSPSISQSAGAEASLSQDQIESMYALAKEEWKKFIDPFDFQLANIEDRGFTTYATPVGTERVKHIHLEMTMDEIVSFAASLLGYAAEYDGLETFFAELIKVVEPEAEAEEELAESIDELRASLRQAKSVLEMYDPDLVEGMLGLKLDVLLQSDVYVTSSLEPIGIESVLDVAVSDPASGESVKATLTVIDQRWNTNQAVKLPNVDLEQALSFEELSEREKIQELGEDSIVRAFAEQWMRRTGRIVIGSPMAFVKSEPIVLEAAPFVTATGHTMVPVKVISEIAGTEAKWNAETNEASFEADGRTVVVTIGSTVAVVNGERVEMPEPAAIVNGRTFVPLRFITENLGADVTWEAETKSVIIEFP